MSLDRANKTAPNGKQILKNVGVAMYLGAKIGFLGQNGDIHPHHFVCLVLYQLEYTVHGVTHRYGFAQTGVCS